MILLLHETGVYFLSFFLCLTFDLCIIFIADILLQVFYYNPYSNLTKCSEGQSQPLVMIRQPSSECPCYLPTVV